ncbi:nicotinate-nicotinamide nucleotide adenylyltransferase [Candidatus Saccharibacteria bacterium]|jgi:nicotinate-nucleotide adenylyltransferase|nr:nicotinate-nicotinamide nucleotide adenylyltransferase [Candidatus Saccharibacteria bacterium]
MVNKIGILSGTFDPIHDGHLALARAARNQLGLQKVWFVVESEPRHKTAVASYDDRLVMVKSGICELDEVIEVTQATHDLFTLDELMSRAQSSKFYFLLGADVATRMREWSDYKVINEKTKIVTFARSVKNHVADIILSHPAKSSQIRQQLKDHDKVNTLPEPVHRYIKQKGLYV